MLVTWFLGTVGSGNQATSKMAKFAQQVSSGERAAKLIPVVWDIAVRLNFLFACVLLLDGGMGREINTDVTVKCSFTTYSPL